MLRLMRELTTHRSCRWFQDPVPSALNHTVRISHGLWMQTPGGSFTVFFSEPLSPGGVMPQNTTKFCPHDKDIHSYKQEVSRHQTGHQVSTSLQVTCEEYNNFPPAFHLTGHGQLLNYPEPAYYQGALMFQNRTSTKKSPFVQPLPSPATLLPLELIASTSFLQLGW